MGGAVSRLDSSRGITASRGRRLAERTGRPLILGAVAFWWGVIVVPRLVSLGFPELLSPDAIPRHLDPDEERTVANAVSAASLLIVALLAFAMVRQAHHARSYWITKGGWTVLAVTAAYLAWEEVSEFHVSGTRDLGDVILGSSNLPWLWPMVLSPLIVAFVLAMAVFVRKGLASTGSTGPSAKLRTGSWQASSGREVRAPLILGLAAWLLAVAYEVSYPFVFQTRAAMLAGLLEETLEFGGTLLIGLSAGLALRRSSRQAHGRQARDEGRGAAAGIFSGSRLMRLAVGSMAAVGVLAVVAAVVYRGPLADARARSYVGAFHVDLRDSVVAEHSLVQELGVLAAPVARFDLRVANRDPQGRSGTMLWRVMEAGEGGEGPILREGRKEVPAGEHPKWMSIDFPPLAYAEGRRLMAQLVADVEPGAHLRVGATKTNRFEDGRLWVNGEPAWPDQNIEFAVYMAAKPTLGKLRTMWDIFTSDWRWPVLAAEVAIAMTLVTFIPALLATAALQRRGSRW